MPGRYLISFISYFLPLLVSHSNPQIIVFLSSYIFFHSCKHTFDSDSIWIYYHLTFWYLPTKWIQKFLFPHSILWSSGYFVPDCTHLSHYWNSDDLSLLSFVFAPILFNLHKLIYLHNLKSLFCSPFDFFHVPLFLKCNSSLDSLGDHTFSLTLMM